MPKNTREGDSRILYIESDRSCNRLRKKLKEAYTEVDIEHDNYLKLLEKYQKQLQLNAILQTEIDTLHNLCHFYKVVDKEHRHHFGAV